MWIFEVIYQVSITEQAMVLYSVLKPQLRCLRFWVEGQYITDRDDSRFRDRSVNYVFPTFVISVPPWHGPVCQLCTPCHSEGWFHSKQVRWDNCDCHSLFIESFLDKTTLIIEVSVSDCHSRKLKSYWECGEAHKSLRGWDAQVSSSQDFYITKISPNIQSQ